MLFEIPVERQSEAGGTGVEKVPPHDLHVPGECIDVQETGTPIYQGGGTDGGEQDVSQTPVVVGVCIDEEQNEDSGKNGCPDQCQVFVIILLPDFQGDDEGTDGDPKYQKVDQGRDQDITV